MKTLRLVAIAAVHAVMASNAVYQIFIGSAAPGVAFAIFMLAPLITVIYLAFCGVLGSGVALMSVIALLMLIGGLI